LAGAAGATVTRAATKTVAAATFIIVAMSEEERECKVEIGSGFLVGEKSTAKEGLFIHLEQGSAGFHGPVWSADSSAENPGVMIR
jgi:hypothetical protein